MRKCKKCRIELKEVEEKTAEGVSYSYWMCSKCGDEFLDKGQLHSVAEKFRKLKRYHAKISKWGSSLGLRLPKELVKKYKFSTKNEVEIIPEENCLKIIAA